MKLSEIILRGGYVDREGVIRDPDCSMWAVYLMHIERDVDIEPGMPIAEQVERAVKAQENSEE